MIYFGAIKSSVRFPSCGGEKEESPRTVRNDQPKKNRKHSIHLLHGREKREKEVAGLVLPVPFHQGSSHPVSGGFRLRKGNDRHEHGSAWTRKRGGDLVRQNGPKKGGERHWGGKGGGPNFCLLAPTTPHPRTPIERGEGGKSVLDRGKFNPRGEDSIFAGIRGKKRNFLPQKNIPDTERNTRKPMLRPPWKKREKERAILTTDPELL